MPFFLCVFSGISLLIISRQESVGMVKIGQMQLTLQTSAGPESRFLGIWSQKAGHPPDQDWHPADGEPLDFRAVLTNSVE